MNDIKLLDTVEFNISKKEVNDRDIFVYQKNNKN